MTNLSYRKNPNKNPNTVRLKLLWNSVDLHQAEIGLVLTLTAIGGYMAFVSPVVLIAALLAGAISISFGLLNRSALTMTGFGLPIKAWHLGSVVVALAAIAAVGHFDPVSAQMFGNLEEAVTESLGEIGGEIDEGVVETIFVIFRILIVLAFLIGVVIVFTQATRGGDWQPIANLLGIGVAFVIGVEVISLLIIGDGGGGAGG